MEMTVKQAAQEAACSEVKLRKRIRNGTLNARKSGAIWLVNWRDVKRLLDKGELSLSSGRPRVENPVRPRPRKEEAVV